MTRKRKGRAGNYQAASRDSTNEKNFTRAASRTKAVILTLAVWGLIPVPVADWIINRGGLRDV